MRGVLIQHHAHPPVRIPLPHAPQERADVRRALARRNCQRTRPVFTS
jgi:hypothetical protein